MGRAALIVVMGLGVAFGFIGFSLNQTSTSAVEAQMEYLRYTIARNLARDAVHLALRAIDRGESFSKMDGEFNGGSYSVELSASIDTMWMTSTGTYEDKSYQIKLKLMRGTKPFPSVNGTVGFRATPVDFNMSGGSSIDGRNYTADGSMLTGSGDRSGVATMSSSDSALVKSVGGSKILGSPPVKVDTNTANPLNYVDEYRANADYVYGPGVYSSVTWGSASNPVIVVCETPDTMVSVRFTGNVLGYGILVVRGNLTIAGNFRFRGLVIVYGENNIVNASASMGTPEIIGGLILAGLANSSLELRGTAKLKYSSEALTESKNIGKLRYYSILNWYE